jgi:hypothetical protein
MPSILCVAVFGVAGLLLIDNATGCLVGILVGYAVSVAFERWILGWSWDRIWKWREPASAPPSD